MRDRELQALLHEVERPMWYRLDKNFNPVPTPLMEWALFSAAIRGSRWIARDEFSGILISTIFTGLDTAWSGPALIFETMVFGGPLDMQRERYSTWNDAMRGHAEMYLRVVAELGRQDAALPPPPSPGADS